MILSLLFAVASFQAATQTPAVISYETYCRQDEAEKKQVFRAAPPETKAVLARTQIERWRDANQATLTAEQLDVIKELLSVTTVETFALSRADQRTKLSAVEARAGAAFKGRELDAMGPTGPCLPKKAAK
jgi:predicted cobalt transporter CbtA